MGEPQTFTDVQPIQAMQTFTDVQPINSPASGMRLSNPSTIPNARIRNMPNPVDPSWGPGRALYEGAKTGVTLASIPAAVGATPTQLVAGVAGGTVGAAAGKEIAKSAGAGEFGQEVGGDVGGLAGGVVAGGAAGWARAKAQAIYDALPEAVQKELIGVVSPRVKNVLHVLDALNSAKATEPVVPEAAAPEVLNPAPIPEPMAKTAAGDTIPRTVPPKPTTVTDLARQINEALGGKPLKPGVPLRSQAAAAAKLPEGFTPVDSTALKGYKYDPAAREFESITQNGQHYIHGDVSPEDAQAFADADSKGKAWQQIRQNPLVAKVVNGKRVSIHPARSMMADPSETGSPKSDTPAKPAATNDDLTAILQESLKRARQARASQ